MPNLFLGAMVWLAACADGANAPASGEDIDVTDTGLFDVAADGSGSGAVTDSGADGSGEVTPGTVQDGQPCTQDRDCEAGVCIDIPGVSGQSICTVICRSDSDCGAGLDCVPVTTGADAVSACIPDNQCLDGDGDGFGFGAACTGLDCDDADPAVNPRGVEGCDGLDNDCDGLIDDAPIDAGRSCETGFAGRCAQGVTVCSSNALECQPEVLPEEEVCDGLDNDCDGAADEDDSGQPLSRTCYDGPAGTVGVGVCAGGRQTCEAGDFGGCLGQTLPAVEICDSVDNNCNGLADDETREVTWYLDADGDGFGSPLAPTISACVPPVGYVLNADDCDDASAAVRPGAAELPGDGLDSDCDGTEVCFADQDGDGFVSGSAIRSADADCADPGEFDLTALGGDCDDSDPQSYPGAPEIVGNEADNDCDGREICFADADGDGVRSADEVVSENVVCTDAGEARLTSQAGDCDDRDAAIRPGQLESCNGVDDDCNGAVDDRLPTRRYFVDRDGDGFGTSQIAAIDSCAPVPGYVENDGDCDDSSGDVLPGAVEGVGDGIDQNCDGREVCFADADGDGYRGAETLVSADSDCIDAGEASAVTPAGDCLDSDRLVRPGVTEIPGDGVDQNCDGQESCYADADGDGARTDALIASSDTLCDALGEASPRAVAGDCDDLNASRRPGATEVCNGVDDNCDGVADEGLATQSYWRDADGDGYGAAGASPTLSCGPVAGAVSNDGDCDDARAAVKPGATEIAGDGVDQNCDGQELCYLDADDDGYRPGSSVTVSADTDCLDGGEALAGEPEGDCDDSNPSVLPGTAEGVGDGVDQNCDGQELCYLDADDDGYRPDGGATVVSSDLRCDAPTEAVPSDPAGDCADTDGGRNPGAPELCDGVDNDCNGLTDDSIVTLLYYPDRDGDGRGDASASSVSSCANVTGSVANTQDCNDNDPTVYTGAVEVAGDGVDQNCDGQELCYLDLDADGFRVDATRISSRLACDGSGEASASATGPDCDDLDELIYPGGVEEPGDGVDGDCDGGELCFANADGDGYRTDVTAGSIRLRCDGVGEAAAALPAGDCDDASAARFPGAPEVCDGVDQDCDGVADDGLATLVYYSDGDGDGFGGASALGVTSCGPVAGSVANRDDCNDADAAVRPSATESAGDGVDQNCDGRESCFVDGDGDGFRNGAAVVDSADADCADPGEASLTAPATDCDDTTAAVRPGAVEIAGDDVDQNCDGSELCFVNADGDGYRTLSTVSSSRIGCDVTGLALATLPAGDCDDASPSRYPGAPEFCDGVDQDCDGTADNGLSTQNYYTDADGDGFGSSTAPAVASCRSVSGSVTNLTDCDDTNGSIRPGASEITGDNLDQNCDGTEVCFVDGDGDGYRFGTGVVLSTDTDCLDAGEAEASSATGDCNDADASVSPAAAEIAGDEADQNCDGSEVCFVDADGDGYRPAGLPTRSSGNLSCADAGEARATAGTGDCDDTSANRNPGLVERCDGIDNDCNVLVDDAVATQSYYPDGDGDLRGDATATPLVSCAAVAGRVANALDCNDANPTIYGGASEVAGDGVDQNCDGAELCFEDTDGDGYRSSLTGTSASLNCSEAGFASSAMPSGDCNDLNAAVRPNAVEGAGDGVDQNCDGLEICFVNADGDAFRTTGTTVVSSIACNQPGTAPASVSAGDCDDSSALRYPGAPEICDGVDQDCDGVSDNGLATLDYYPDADGDGFGRSGATATASCRGIAGSVTNSGDCDDTRATFRPGVSEVTGDGQDQNCDGQETCFADGDGDGFRNGSAVVISSDADCSDAGEALASAPDTDCNDAVAAVRPGATELPGDTVDQNCDGQEICFVNSDGDGYRTTATTTTTRLSCDGSGQALAALPAGDCDDGAATRYPGAPELCDGIDQDCDGVADNGLARLNYYPDADGDGFGRSGATATDSCRGISGSVTNDGDCDDARSAIRPGVTEVAGDGLDQNCDGQELCYVDADSDGYRNGSTVTVSADVDCFDLGEALATAPDTDCNDLVGAIRPGVTEVAGDSVDQNCDGTELCFVDADRDGYRVTGGGTVLSLNLSCADPGEAALATNAGDCADADATRNPGATEICDGVDQDCDGVADDGLATQNYYVDADGDLRGALGSVPVNSCAPVAGRVASSTDCNDDDASVFPGAVEVAGDGVDQNCDDQELCYRNADGDAYRTDATVLSLSLGCSATGLANRARLNGDCDDFDAAVYPGAFEVAGDGIDQSCDSQELCYVNADNDPYRTSTTILSPRLACNGSGEAPSSRPLGDCDDTNSTRYPGAPELCNGVDDDCNLAVDDGVPTQNYYLDADGDTYGAAGSTPVASCSTVAGRVLNASDCNDASAAIRPGVTEIAGDSVDQNCDGAEVCFADTDDDGYRPNLTSITLSADTDCNDAAEAVAADPAGDCNDATAAVRPNATEIPADGVDQNCDTQELCYADADNDGYRPNATATVVSPNLVCTDAGERGASAPTTDCNDLTASISPGASEVVADGVDQDCNGAELCYLDNDSDGYRPNATATLSSADLDCADTREARGDIPTTDCNDSNAAINPGVDVDGDGLNACLDCVDSNNRIPGGVIQVTGNTASVEWGDNLIDDLFTTNFRASNAVVARVADVNVRVNLNHTWDGDLVLSLISPSGTVVALSTNIGGPGQNFSTTLFDDEAATAISAGAAPFNGSYRPSSPLNAFDTQTMSGNWTLRVADTVGSDSGYMNSWSIDITTACP